MYASGALSANLTFHAPSVSCNLPFFFDDAATTEIYTLSLHDALPIYDGHRGHRRSHHLHGTDAGHRRSEEHTSELQSLTNLVCRLLLEKKKDGRGALSRACRAHTGLPAALSRTYGS